MRGCSDGAEERPMSGYAAERHRPGQGAQHLDYLEASGEKPHESSPRPVIEMPGRVTEVADVREARQVECPPQRLAWHARDQPGAGEAREHVERALGVLQVLEHLAAQHELGRIPVGIEALDRGRLELDRHPRHGRPPPRLHQDLGEGVAASDTQAAACQADRELSLAATDLMRLAHTGSLDQLIEPAEDRKSTRLNSSHTVISYAVFCLKKKKKKYKATTGQKKQNK